MEDITLAIKIYYKATFMIQRYANRPKKQNRDHRNKPTVLWSLNL